MNAVIFVDDRERRSNVVNELMKLGWKVNITRLDIADYVIGRKYGIERKTPNDLINSIIDKRLFEQARYLREAYEVPIIIIEGDIGKALYFRNIKINQIFGAIAAIIEMGISVIQTTDSKETAIFITVLAKRVQRGKRRYLTPTKIRVIRAGQSIPIIQLNLLSSIPGISVELAHKILEHFKTPRRFFKASSSEIKKVPGLGEKRIKRIIEVLDTVYIPSYSNIGEEGEDEKNTI